MKPLGQKPHKQNFEDHHIKGFRNWWEAEGCDENKAADKRLAKKLIEEELESL